jgi:hypothetical protein
MRQGLFPSFDDIDLEQLHAYLAKHASDIEATLVQADVGGEYGALLDAIDRYEAAVSQWHASEPRYLPRFFQAVTRLIEAPRRKRS